MATATRNIAEVITTAEDLQREARLELDRALTNNSDAVIEFIHLVRQLHDKQLLNMVISLFEQGTDVLEVLVNQAKRPQYAGAFKNLLGLVQLVGTLDVAVLSEVLNAAKEAAHRETPDVGGVFKLLGTLRDPDVGTGMGFIIEVLKSLGNGLRNDGASITH